MAKVNFSIFMAILLAMLAPLCANAQEYIEFEEFEKDTSIDIIVQLAEIANEINNLNIQTENINDVENLDYEYQKYGQIVESYKALINKADGSFLAFDECSRAYYNLTKKINEIKDKESRKNIHRTLLSAMNDCMLRMTEVENRCKRFVGSNNADSLQLEKKKADLLLNAMLTKYYANQDIAESYQDLKDLRLDIELKKASIDEMSVKNSGVGELVFKITMLVGILFIPFNIIKTKIKMAKELKAKGIEMPKTPKANKKEEDLPII